MINFTKWPIECEIKCQNSSTKIIVRKGNQNERVVEKVIRINPRNKQYVQKQIQIMKKINSPFVIKCLDSKIYQQQAHIFMPYFENGDLEQFITKQKQIPFKIKIRMLLDILIGLKELHKIYIIHRDIKLKNIFVNSNHQCVLGDLGILSVGSLAAMSKIGTVGYQAPEVYRDEYEEYDNKVDIWAIGIICYQLLNKKQNEKISHPFCSINQLAKTVYGYGGNVIYKKYKQFMTDLRPFDLTIPEPLVQMIKQMLIFDPQKRISFQQLYSTKYLAPYDQQNELFSFVAQYKQIESITKKAKENLNFILQRKQIFFKMDKLYKNIINYEKQAIVKDNKLKIYQYYYLLMKKIEDRYQFIKQQNLVKLLLELNDLVKQVKKSFRNTDISDQLNHWCKKYKIKSIENNPELLSNQYFKQLEQDIIPIIDSIQIFDQK